jgi:hypothetical protein
MSGATQDELMSGAARVSFDAEAGIHSRRGDCTKTRPSEHARCASPIEARGGHEMMTGAARVSFGAEAGIHET